MDRIFGAGIDSSIDASFGLKADIQFLAVRCLRILYLSPSAASLLKAFLSAVTARRSRSTYFEKALREAPGMKRGGMRIPPWKESIFPPSNPFCF
jgi:hypothetical protein